ncbi:MAG: hypothetical protein EOM21_21300 [Gammaproteobacteria bacterium]|nr:hypothetical protein [Gammaproteobacteria bacterium]
MTSTHVMGAERPARPLLHTWILVCGKGGSGWSTLAALDAHLTHWNVESILDRLGAIAAGAG